MATASIIRFPPPPPTRNQLSSDQRAKLIRTNNKLGRVLGSTPHVLDFSSYIVPVASKEQMPAPPKTPTPSRNPFRTHNRSKSAPKFDADTIRMKTMSPHSVASASSDPSRKSAKSIHVKPDELAWRAPYPIQRPPLLRLSVPSPSRRPKLETIPSSPPADQTSDSTLVPIEVPNFSLPSEAAMRREKMRRVRKVLGDGVPNDLVFPPCPEEYESEPESEQEDSPTTVSARMSTMSSEWLLSDTNRPLPDVHKPLPKPVPEVEDCVQPSATSARRNRLFKGTVKPVKPVKPVQPSKGAKRLESIAESAKESRPESMKVVGLSVSTGQAGLGKSRRFIEGEVQFDQIGTVWGGGSFW